MYRTCTNCYWFMHLVVQFYLFLVILFCFSLIMLQSRYRILYIKHAFASERSTKVQRSKVRVQQETSMSTSFSSWPSFFHTPAPSWNWHWYEKIIQIFWHDKARSKTSCDILYGPSIFLLCPFLLSFFPSFLGPFFFCGLGGKKVNAWKKDYLQTFLWSFHFQQILIDSEVAMTPSLCCVKYWKAQI